LLYLYEDATRVPRKKEVRKKVKGMSKKSVQALLSVPDLSTKTGRRDLALMIFMYSTATRMDETLSLKMGFQKHAATVHSLTVGYLICLQK
jgi:site-specific recombinase XerD